MTSDDLRALRKSMALTQYGLATALGVSRKTINELEKGDRVDARTALAVEALARRIKLVEDSYWVESTTRGTYAVVRRTVRELPHDRAMHFTKSELMLYGEFARREHAYRWSAALRSSFDPRNTRKLRRQRDAELAERLLADEAFDRQAA